MSAPAAACRQALETALAEARPPSAAEIEALASAPPGVLEEAVREFGQAHGEAAAPVLAPLVAEGVPKAVRRAVRRALYRLGARVPVPAPEAPRPLVARVPERPVRAWLSGIDGSGARAAWILFEGAYGALRLCSLILSDTEGIADAAGGDITRKRLERELAELRASQKLPWVEVDPGRAVGLVAEALAHHRATGTPTPAAFARWRPLFEEAAPAAPPPLPADPDPALVERSADLLELPEMSGWFLDPARVQADALELLQARESRLVVSDQVRAEREAAIVDAVVEREMDAEGRRRWGRRLAEMALVFEASGRGEHAEMARAAAAALVDDARDPRRHPLAVALARRALEIAAEIALGRLPASQFAGTAGPAQGEAPAAEPAPTVASPPLIVTPHRPRR